MTSIGNINFVQVDSEELKKAVYRLRYQVYAEEFGFEKAADCPDGLEIDKYDENSIHFAALDEQKNIIGTVRLVVNSEKGFPVEQAAGIHIFGKKSDLDKTVEISRLAVSKLYRRRAEDGFLGIESYISKSEGGIVPDDGHITGIYQRRKRPVIILGLFRSLYQACKKMGIEYMYLIAEKKLFYLLKRQGFIFDQIGDPVNYHGLRIPYYGVIRKMEQNLGKNKPKIFKMMTSGLDEKYHPKL